MSELIDDPQWDGTDAAHPAFWRGQDDGVRGAVRLARRAMNGEHLGSIASPELQALCEDLALPGRCDPAPQQSGVMIVQVGFGCP